MAGQTAAPHAPWKTGSILFAPGQASSSAKRHREGPSARLQTVGALPNHGAIESREINSQVAAMSAAEAATAE